MAEFRRREPIMEDFPFRINLAQVDKDGQPSYAFRGAMKAKIYSAFFATLFCFASTRLTSVLFPA
jgi:hypothetical protein